MRIAIVTSLLLALASSLGATTVGDVARFQGERENYLQSVGVVVGLAGTGDSAGFVNQALSSLLSRRRIHVDASQINARNVAVVWVHARLQPFLREGQAIDVTVASMNDAKSLFGGHLIETPLEGADGRVYAVAAGPVTVGGFLAAGQAAQVRQNHTLVGRVPGGGIVERELDWDLVSPHHEVGLLLRQPELRTATRVARAINDLFPGAAVTRDAVKVAVVVPEEWRDEDRVMQFLARLVDIRVEPAMPSRIVLNERTGTIVSGGEISIGAVTISHGNLIVAISEAPEVSQPAPLSGGETKVVPRTSVETEEGAPPPVRIPAGTSVGDMAAALNAVGITPRDMVTIFQMLRTAGALHAELVVE